MISNLFISLLQLIKCKCSTVDTSSLSQNKSSRASASSDTQIKDHGSIFTVACWSVWKFGGKFILYNALLTFSVFIKIRIQRTSAWVVWFRWSIYLWIRLACTLECISKLNPGKWYCCFLIAYWLADSIYLNIFCTALAIKAIINWFSSRNTSAISVTLSIRISCS